MNLAELGWNAFFEGRFSQFKGQGLVPARVACEHRHAYDVLGEAGEMIAEVSGKLRYQTRSRGELPAVGDWVAVQARTSEGRATIQGVLPRKSKFSRKVAGGTSDEQVVAANVETVFLVAGLDGDFNLRRMERYIAAAWDSGANPVIVLNKADACQDMQERLVQVESVAVGIPVHAVSAERGEGLDALAKYLAPGKTTALLGSSGVGKSTLINALLGQERQEVFAVREDDSRGRHTTTRRELIVLPSGGVVIDTPGMRALQMWSDEPEAPAVFDDVEQLVARCRFSDCRHAGEPGCAVQQALAAGQLDSERYQSYLKLQRELRHLASRQDQRIREEEKARWKKISQLQKRLKRDGQT